MFVVTERCFFVTEKRPRRTSLSYGLSPPTKRYAGAAQARVPSVRRRRSELTTSPQHGVQDTSFRSLKDTHKSMCANVVLSRGPTFRRSQCMDVGRMDFNATLCVSFGGRSARAKVFGVPLRGKGYFFSARLVDSHGFSTFRMVVAWIQPTS